MEKILENEMQQVSFDYFKNHPELITDVLAQSDDISLLLRREGDQVFFYYQGQNSEQVNEILELAKIEHRRKKSEGYDSEQAFQDFMIAQQEISKYLE
jgi:hypothetical protein